jgi:alpha-mannosidase
LFGPGGLAVVTVEDPWGIWGDFNDSPESLSLTTMRQRWSVTRVEVTEPGPLRAMLRVRLEGGRSRIDLTFALCSGRDALDVEARAFWDERCARLELAFEGGYTRADYDVLGGQVSRSPVGEVPGGRWVHAQGPSGEIGFASDALYGFNLTPQGALLATIARATRYAADAPAGSEEHLWRPVLDSGELRFRFLLAPDPKSLPRLAAELVEPPLALTVTPSAGEWARSASLLALEPEAVRLLALKPAEDARGWILRLHSQAEHPLQVRLTWLGQTFDLPALSPLELATYRLEQNAAGGWSVEKCVLLE